MIQQITSTAAGRAGIEIDDIVAGLKQIAQDEELKPSDRIKAFGILGRYKGMFVNRVELTEEKPQVIFCWPPNGRDPEDGVAIETNGSH